MDDSDDIFGDDDELPAVASPTGGTPADPKFTVIDPGAIRAAAADAAAEWDDNWLGREPRVDPAQLLAHPRNARVHTRHQEKALTEALDRVGWLGDVKVNRNTGFIFDGHLRVQAALTAGRTVPVAYYDLTPEQEILALATFDAITSLAVVDTFAFKELIADVRDPGPAIAAMFDIVTARPELKDSGSDKDEDPKPDDFDVVYGMVGWSETKVKASADEIGDLTRLHQKYRADSGGTDDGFVAWLIRNAHD